MVPSPFKGWRCGTVLGRRAIGVSACVSRQAGGREALGLVVRHLEARWLFSSTGNREVCWNTLASVMELCLDVLVVATRSAVRLDRDSILISLDMDVE